MSAGTFAWLKAQPDRPPATNDPVEIDRQFRYWRARILMTSIIGYALYYFVRSNISVPLKTMGAELGYTKAELGFITITCGGVTYGISKFVNGFLGDRSNPRFFMAIGLLGSAAMNVCFGFSSSLLFLATFWTANNWFQGMGFPPCARNMGYWFTPKERGTSFGIWHTSHMIGGALILALTGYLVKHLGWRSCFYIPAAIAAVGAVFLAIFLRDTPGSLGLPHVEVYKGEETPEQLAREIHVDPQAVAATAPQQQQQPSSPVLNYEAPVEHESYLRLVLENIFKSPFMWIISIANTLVYVMRDTQMKWGPTILQEMKQMDVVIAGWLGFGSEIAGMVSALVGGLIADRLFGGRAGRVCCVAMIVMVCAIYAFWQTPASFPGRAGTLFVLMGFCLYIPQMLIAAMAMNLGTKRAAAAAVGLTGLLGYAGTVMSGWGMGKLHDVHGRWDEGLMVMMGCAAGTLVLMAFTWNVGAHPHAKPADPGEVR